MSEHAALTIRTYPTGMYARGRFALAEDFGLDPTKGVQSLFSLHLDSSHAGVGTRAGEQAGRRAGKPAGRQAGG